MTDQERITDLILLEKKMTGNYNEFACECVDPSLREEFLNLLQQEHRIQSDLFTMAQSRGWYNPQPAEAAKINQTFQKFSQLS